MDFNYISVDAVIVISFFVMQFMLFRNGVLEKRKIRFFSFTVFLTIAAVLAQIGTTLTDNTALNNRFFSVFFNAAAFIISPFIPVLFSFVFTEKRKTKKIFYFLPAIINAVFVFISAFNGLVFYVNGQNRYSRGPLFFIYIAAYLFGFAMIALSGKKLARKYQFKTKIMIFVLLAFLMSGTSLQVINPEIHTTTICIALAIILYYAMLCEQSNRFDIQTNLLNRRTFEEEILRFKKVKEGTFIIFDVDNFKYINDTYGHMFGDYCLTTLAQPILDRFENDGYSFRIGGDEFCTLCFTGDEKKIQKLLKLVVQDVDLERVKDKRIPHLSYGCKTFKRDKNNEVDIDEIMREADKQMYEYKRISKA